MSHKKVVYMAPWEFSAENPDGVCKKLLNQCAVFEHEFDTYLVLYSDQNVVVLHNGNTEIHVNKKNQHRRRLLYTVTEDLCSSIHADVLMVRYGDSDPLFISMCKRISQYARILVEIASYPYDQEIGTSFHDRILAIVDNIYRKQLHKYVSRIICASNEREIFGIPVIKIQNGIIVSNAKPAACKIEKDIHLICVSSMEKWHAYERLIQGLDQYYITGGQRNIILDIVGKGPNLEVYQKDADTPRLKGHVIFHGFQSGANLDALYDKATAAVTSLGLHRIGISEENTIKTREYAAKGMLIISGAQKDMFDSSYPYLLRLPADESPVDFNSILTFLNQYAADQKSLTVSAESIRSYAEENFDMEVVLQPVFRFITE